VCVCVDGKSDSVRHTDFAYIVSSSILLNVLLTYTNLNIILYSSVQMDFV